MNKIRDIDSSLIDQIEKSLSYTLVFGGTHLINRKVERYFVWISLNLHNSLRLWCESLDGYWAKHSLFSVLLYIPLLPRYNIEF